jgi:hypothetical protein
MLGSSNDGGIIVRRFLLLTVTGMVAICAVSVGSAYAGNGSATSQFFTVYTDTNGVQSDCTGTRVVQKDGTVKDSATCILTGDTSRLVSGTIVGNPGYCLNAVCWPAWVSDFDGKIAKSVILNLTSNGDGTFTQKVTAYY